jgi:hypothetical protein
MNICTRFCNFFTTYGCPLLCTVMIGFIITTTQPLNVVQKILVITLFAHNIRISLPVFKNNFSLQMIVMPIFMLFCMLFLASTVGCAMTSLYIVGGSSLLFIVGAWLCWRSCDTVCKSYSCLQKSIAVLVIVSSILALLYFNCVPVAVIESNAA